MIWDTNILEIIKSFDERQLEVKELLHRLKAQKYAIFLAVKRSGEITEDQENLLQAIALKEVIAKKLIS